MGLIERRIGLLFAVFVLLFGAALLRTAQVTVVQGASLKQRALGQQMGTQTLPAPRGAILDRNGAQLAVSTDAADISATPYLVKEPRSVALALAPLLDVEADKLALKLSDRSQGFVYLKRGLDGNAAEKLRKAIIKARADHRADDKALSLDGIDVVQTSERAYPQRTLAAQMLGFVGTDGDGLSGLEYAFEKQLHGTDGERRVVKDARGDPIQTVEAKRVRPGTDVELTLDSQLQLKTEAVLAEVGQKFRPKGATAVVMDPRTGEVLALANWPRVDANDPTSAPDYARQNRAIGFTYEPGSTFKAITVAGAVQEKVVTPDTTFDLPPTLQVQDRIIKESHPRGPVSLTVSQILAQSSNVGSVKIGQALGEDHFDKWVHRFGFGSPTGVDLQGEERGIVPRRADYSGSSIGNLPIGQGLAVTPMQMATAYSAIANGGTLRPPRVVRSIGGKAEVRPAGHRVISQRTAASLRKMLKGVVGPGGTASEAAIPGYDLAGKTGTAQKPDEYGGYSKSKFVGSFIGFAPANRPRLLVAVMVDEPQGQYYGGLVAAPAFQQILNFALPYYKIPPS
ncbi:MAG: penicillin-binding protein 2, partial [Thermoleophilaceae bacterium]|nr:penicillin-binding protein 2 [Thermoleophilaceae bacterium]